MQSKTDTSDFLSEEAIVEALAEMEKDEMLNTKPIYIRDADDSLRLISFREKHLTYLKWHPKTNPQNYLANIRTMIRIRI